MTAHFENCCVFCLIYSALISIVEYKIIFNSYAIHFVITHEFEFILSYFFMFRLWYLFLNILV